MIDQPQGSTFLQAASPHAARPSYLSSGSATHALLDHGVAQKQQHSCALTNSSRNSQIILNVSHNLIDDLDAVQELRHIQVRFRSRLEGSWGGPRSTRRVGMRGFGTRGAANSGRKFRSRLLRAQLDRRTCSTSGKPAFSAVFTAVSHFASYVFPPLLSA